MGCVFSAALVAWSAAAAAQEEPAPPVPAPEDRLTDEQRFEQGQTLFEFGDCESVIRVLDDFALGGVGRDEAQLVEAHRMLGVCYFQLGRRTEAERELKQLLYLNPDYELDPFLTPPPVVALFDELKVQLREELDKIRAARRARETPQTSQPPSTVVIERVRSVKSTPWVAAFIPFGGAQYVNGEPVKAVTVAALQIGAVLFHALVFGLLQLVHPQGLIVGEFPPVFLRTDYSDPSGTPVVARPWFDAGRPVIPIGEAQDEVANVLFGAQLFTAAAILAVYSGGVVDALISRDDEVVTKETSRTLPPGEAPPEAALFPWLSPPQSP